MAKKKTTIVNRRRVLTDPVFELTRQNNAEFTRACKANRLLRRAFALAMLNKADRYVSGRLTKIMFKILQTDSVNDRGERKVTKGELGILEGFNFNRDTSLQNVLYAPYSVLIRYPREPLQLQLPVLEHKSSHAIIIALGIEFFHELHGWYHKA